MDYRSAGVDVAAADAAKARIARLAKGTFNASVLTEIGSFGGMFRLDLARFQDPVLVSSTDGVGTKLHVANLMGRHDTVGYDLVAHCVNDILVQGAVPLFFLDYIALGRMDEAKVEAIVSGLARACREFGCPLIGGETAEMPGTYAPDDYDLAGFIVGVVDRAQAITGAAVRAGDVLLGLPSAGLHTNGYTLARKALLELGGMSLDRPLPELGATVGEALLAPHKSYLAPLTPLLPTGQLHALVHITGGGFQGNIPRVLPEGLGVRVRRSAWEVPPLFRAIQAAGQIADDEMFRTFNMGVGMIAIVAREAAAEVARILADNGETTATIGEVISGVGVQFE